MIQRLDIILDTVTFWESILMELILNLQENTDRNYVTNSMNKLQSHE